MELVLIRIQRSKQQWLGWSTAPTAASFAAAGARALMRTTPQSTGGGTVVVFVSWEGAELVGGPGRRLQQL